MPHRDFPSIPPESATNGQLLMILQSMHAQASVQGANLSKLADEVKTLRDEQADLLEAWRTSKNVVRFVRVTATLAGIVLGSWAAFRAWLAS
jgi:hypothetical protein